MICPEGYYCPTAALSNPIPCIGGKYCPEGSIDQIDCGLGFFCHEKFALPEDCPEAYMCTTINIDIYTKCDNHYYCPVNSVI